jgi:acyl-CoA reductase-like NAD-dependent aldehyde dehydrogenase
MTTVLDPDLQSLAGARRAAESAYAAWQEFSRWEPDEVDRIVEVMVAAVVPHAERLAEMAVEESGYGNVRDKTLKNLYNSIAVSDWLRGVKTLGVLWKDETTKVAAIGEPMGVVAALIPITSPTAIVIFKTLSAVKSGNAVVHAPHPRGVRCGAETARILSEAATAAGAPRGLIGCLESGSFQATRELMSHPRVAVVMATGGSGMVRAAYSSGKPTLAVGPGNVPTYVDRSKSGDLDEVADMIISSKALDHGTACVAEQAVIVDKPVADGLRRAMRRHGAHFCTASEARALSAVVFNPDGSYVTDNVGQSAPRLAELSGFSVPPRIRVLVTDQTEVGRAAPLSAEKLSPVLAFYTVSGQDEGFRLSEEVLRFGGEGHTASVHSHDPEVISGFGRLSVGRLLVNTPCMHGGIGFSADLDPSFMLGTGTVSGSIVSDNVTALHLINIKRIAYESRPWRSLADYLEGRTS